MSLPVTRANVVTTRHFARRRGSSPLARALGVLAPHVVGEQLAISRFVAESIDGRSVVVVPGVPDVDDPAQPEERKLVVLMVQRLADEKMTEVGIEAFARSGLGTKGWRLEIAGTGPVEADLRMLASTLGLEESYEFLGQRFDVGALYRRAGIFLATRPDEPYGLSVVEAMSHGIAVVAARGGGHLETVGCVSDPALFAPGDADDAARLLCELADDTARRARYGAELRALQRERFSTSSQVDETLAVYRRVTA
ncbi:MAG: glycosyltransferase family 4 protein [Deltaproteobacteria bacterium]